MGGVQWGEDRGREHTGGKEGPGPVSACTPQGPDQGVGPLLQCPARPGRTGSWLAGCDRTPARQSFCSCMLWGPRVLPSTSQQGPWQEKPPPSSASGHGRQADSTGGPWIVSLQHPRALGLGMQPPVSGAGLPLPPSRLPPAACLAPVLAGPPWIHREGGPSLGEWE